MTLSIQKREPENDELGSVGFHSSGLKEDEGHRKKEGSPPALNLQPTLNQLLCALL